MRAQREAKRSGAFMPISDNLAEFLENWRS
jgi:hypothetical protein